MERHAADSTSIVAALLLIVVSTTPNAAAQPTFKSKAYVAPDPFAEKYKVSLRVPPQYFIRNDKRVYPHHVTEDYPFNVRRGKKIFFPVAIINSGKDSTVPLKLRYSLHMHKGWKIEQQWKTIDVGSLKPGQRWAKTVTERYYQSGRKRWVFYLDAGKENSFREMSGSIVISTTD